LTDNSRFEFSSEQQAATAMLLEATRLLNAKTIDYAVIGGWVPFLFNSTPIRHPGTYDVDVVLNTAMSKDQVVKALDSMVLGSGYMRAPKNAFQVYRQLRVNGEDMIFHVDFLHRKYADDSGDLLRSWGRYQSIKSPGTDVIFTAKEVRSELVSGTGTDGNPTSSNITFASEAGFLCAKGRAVGTGKRERDAFDIYLVIAQSADLEKLKESSRRLMRDGVFCASIRQMYEEFAPNKHAVDDAAKFLCAVSSDFAGKPERAAEVIRSTVWDFIHDIDDNNELGDLYDDHKRE
jgi:hypothetical protein